ncbi:MAG TPA: hypothetical protein VF407_14270 [Polyangiaceae bacterium]
MTKLRLALLVSFVPIAAVGVYACVEPPPKIDSIPQSGLSLRVTAFGASAEDMKSQLRAVKQNNKGFSVVADGGDGEVLIGLDNDSPTCVQPTALCSYKVAYRIRDNDGKIVAEDVTEVTATSEKCMGLCTKALNDISVRVVEAASASLKNGAQVASASDGGDVSPSTTAASTETGDVADAGHKKSKPKTAAPAAPAKEPALCAVGHGNRLPSDEAEKRAAQVEVLKRIGTIDQDEYDCLRKAYLERL